MGSFYILDFKEFQFAMETDGNLLYKLYKVWILIVIMCDVSGQIGHGNNPIFFFQNKSISPNLCLSVVKIKFHSKMRKFVTFSIFLSFFEGCKFYMSC